MLLASFKSKLRGYLARHSAVVIAYHGVYARSQPFAMWHHMSAERFEEQIAYISRHFNCISVARLLDNLRRGRNEPHSVVVTFDDGFASSLHVALPILRRYQIPAAFFLVSGMVKEGGLLLWPDRLACIVGGTAAQETEFKGITLALLDAEGKGAAYRTLVRTCKTLPVGQRDEYLLQLADCLQVDESAFSHCSWWDDYRVMSPNEVKQLAHEPLVEIGAHTVSHPVLSRTEAGQATHEIVECKQTLERLVGRVRYFAYPYGGPDDYTSLHRQLCIDAGYEAAFSAKLGAVVRGTDPYEIPRMGIGGDTLVSDLEYALGGGVAFATRQLQWM